MIDNDQSPVTTGRLSVGELLDFVIDKSGCRSQNELARRLNIVKQHPSGWRHHTHRPNPAVVIDMAKLAGVDPEILLAAFDCAFTSEKARPYYKKILDTMIRSAAALCITLVLTLHPTPASASIHRLILPETIHYALFRLPQATPLAIIQVISIDCRGPSPAS